MENVLISNPSEFERKKALIRKAGKDTLHVLADFDGTLTKAYVNGEKRNSLVEVIRKYGYLSPEYVEKAYALFDKYHPYEMDLGLDIQTKRAKMQEWWSSHVKVMSEYGMSKEIIARVVKDPPLPTREGMRTFLDTLNVNNIPLIILSASVTDLIEASLKESNLLFPNIHVISNKYQFDANGKVLGYEGKIVHSLNKDETVIRGTRFEKVVSGRKNVLLLGDSIDDVNMLKGFEHDVILKIAFLNDKVEERLSRYQAAYDVVILKDGTMEFVNELLGEILN